MTTIGDHLRARSAHGELLAHATNGAFVTTTMWYMLSTRLVDPLHQNPLLPLSISLRKYLVEELAGLLRTVGESVDIACH
ncbi:MAG: hypothetical protein WAW16_00415 [Candidatus Cryosericum sp.]